MSCLISIELGSEALNSFKASLTIELISTGFAAALYQLEPNARICLTISCSRCGIEYPIQSIPRRTWLRHVAESQLRVADDRDQEVVEIMGYSPRKSPDGFKFLSLEKLGFQHRLFFLSALTVTDVLYKTF